MSRSRNLADLLDANGDVNTANLDNVPAPDLVNDTTPQLGGNLDGQSYNITTTGNVGIGTASPGEKLDVQGNIRLTGGDTYIKFVNAGGYDFSIRGDSGNALRFYSPEYTADPLVSITNGGNVGIGASNPTSHFHLYKNASAVIQKIQNQTSGMQFQMNDGVEPGAGVIYMEGSGPLTLWTGGSQHAKLTSNGNFAFNSGYGSAATAYGCRAWINMQGDGTVSIRGSGNVSSITDDGTGLYTINFSTAMPDANFSVVSQGSWTNAWAAEHSPYVVAVRGRQEDSHNASWVKMAAGVNYQPGLHSAARYDADTVEVAIFR